MGIFEEMRRAVEATAVDRLGEVAAAIWKAYGAGGLTDAEAEQLDTLLNARRGAARATPVKSPRLAGVAMQVVPAAAPPHEGEGTAPARARHRMGSRPRTDASMERRRRWAASGRLPPGLAARFTLAEQAVLALVATEVARRKDCRLAVGHLAAIVGVAETTVRNAIREALKLGLVTVEERRVTGFRNDTNIVRIVAPEWTAWLRLARKGAVLNTGPSLHQGGGCKSANRTPTEVLTLLESRKKEPSKGCRQAAVRARGVPERDSAAGPARAVGAMP